MFPVYVHRPSQKRPARSRDIYAHAYPLESRTWWTRFDVRFSLVSLVVWSLSSLLVFGGRCFWDRILPWVGVGVCVVLSGLLFLATQWSSKWNSWIAFRPSSLAEATHIFVSPVDLERVSSRIVLLLGKNASNPKPLLVEQENVSSEPSSSENLKRRPGKSGSDSDKKTKSSSKSKSFDGYQGSSLDPQTNSQESMLYFVYYCSKFVFLDSQPSLSSSSSTCLGVPCFEASLLHGMYSVRELLQVPSDQERGIRLNGLSSSAYASSLSRYGYNVFDFPVVRFWDLLKEHIVAPFFVFQVFSVLLWIADEYLFFSMLTLFLLVMFEAAAIRSRMTNLNRIRGMGSASNEASSNSLSMFGFGQENPIRSLLKMFITDDAVSSPSIGQDMRVHVLRDGKWNVVMSNQIVPGDVIALRQNVTCPCDILLIDGNVVVNEAMLTGESTPSTKEAISLDQLSSEESCVRIGGFAEDESQRRHVVFGGTKILQAHISRQNDAERLFLYPRMDSPNHSFLGLVLSTGFSSSQGELVKSMFVSASGQSPVADRQAYIFIAGLLLFAASAALHVLYNGLYGDYTDRSPWKLYLHCVMILTSVVPPELPLVLSVAVNASVFRLTQSGVFCTEPIRVPKAGAVQTVCLDKTGTVTSQKIFLDRMIHPNGETITVVPEQRISSSPASLVLSGCHAVSLLGGGDSKTVGDPIEVAAIESLNTRVSSSGDICRAADGCFDLQLLVRFPFIARLQRMSTVHEVKIRASSELESVVLKSNEKPTVDCAFISLVKGSPESIYSCLDLSAPENLEFQDRDKYESLWRKLAAQGGRVLALAWKRLDDDESERSSARMAARNTHRDVAESGLILAGFAVFRCPLKPGARDSITEIQDAGYQVVLVTGDAPLTAVHVSHEIGISSRSVDNAFKARPCLSLVARGDRPVWVNDDQAIVHVLSPAKLFPENWNANNPVICLSGPGVRVLSSLLFTSVVNSSAEIEDASDLDVDAESSSRHVWQIVHSILTLLQYHRDILPSLVVMARFTPTDKEAAIRALREFTRAPVLMCGDGSNDVAALKSSDVGIALLSSDDDMASLHTSSVGKRQLRKDNSSASSSSSRSKYSEDDAADGPIVVDLGDASVAAPFAAKTGSLRESVEQVLLQGRAALITSLQMYRILGINALFSAYALSVLYSAGVKYSDSQMFLAEIIISGFFIVLSSSKHGDRLACGRRPPTNLIGLYSVFTIMGQFLLHVFFMNTTLRFAMHIHGGANSSTFRVFPSLEFGFLPWILNFVVPPSSNMKSTDIDGEFSASLVNTIVFLFGMGMSSSNFLANYQGAPYMQPLSKNKPLIACILASVITPMVLLLEIFPGANAFLQLVAFPSKAVSLRILLFIAGDILSTTILERFLRYAFSQSTGKRK